ncbi:DMT family transporter [Pelagibius sp. Alg239-R121]|uniref:DMT family transporter n=1 Tax=Pelagibius sp. Alg239-R121 TaxID=2993448 RepID=UPI0024A66391|nr:DMT family transporter [Pelagibius sp. Alg239-R121]
MSTGRIISLGSISPLKGVLCMVGAGLFLTLNDAVLKWLTGDYPVGQIMFLRGLFVFLPIILLVWHAGGPRSLRVGRITPHLLRGALMVAGTFLFINGLRHLPFADAISITFAGPLFVTALAAPLLGEVIRWRRWLAVGIGFAGVLIIIRPTSEVAQWAAIFPLAASVTGALRDILTRKMSQHDSSIAVMFYSTIAVTAAGGVTFVGGWEPVQLEDIGLFFLCGFLLGCAHFLMIEAFRLAEAALVVPFKYVSMVWAVVLGLVIWGDIPDAWTFAGAAVVIGSGLYILHRERASKTEG